MKINGDEQRFMDDAIVKAMRSSGHRLNVVDLGPGLPSRGFPDRGLDYLAVRFPGCRGLRLSPKVLHNGWVDALLARKWRFDELWILELEGPCVTDEDLIKVLTSSGLVGLKELSLRNSGISDLGLRAFRNAATQRRGLEALDFGHTRVGNLGLRELAASYPLQQLRRLRLDQTEVTDPGLRRLLGTGWLHRLTELDLRGSDVGNSFVLALATDRRVDSLRRLDLGRTSITDSALRSMAGP